MKKEEAIKKLNVILSYDKEIRRYCEHKDPMMITSIEEADADNNCLKDPRMIPPYLNDVMHRAKQVAKQVAQISDEDFEKIPECAHNYRYYIPRWISDTEELCRVTCEFWRYRFGVALRAICG